MYLHLGQDVVVRICDVIAIFDIDNTSVAKSTRAYLANAQKQGWVVNVSAELPKSFILCRGRDCGATKIYISQISPATLKKRAGFINDIANV